MKKFNQNSLINDLLLTARRRLQPLHLHTWNIPRRHEVVFHASWTRRTRWWGTRQRFVDEFRGVPNEGAIRLARF